MRAIATPLGATRGGYYFDLNPAGGKTRLP